MAESSARRFYIPARKPLAVRFALTGGPTIRRTLLLAGVLHLALLERGQAQSKNLDIYWIDVEGGASTLLIAPSGESLLYDAGYGPPNAVNDRDAKRIAAAAQAAGLKKIDYFVLSHYHADHVGGLPALAKMI